MVELNKFIDAMLAVHELFPLSVCLFLLGLIGLLESREFLSVLIFGELTMLGANFCMLTCSLIFGDPVGQAYVLCILAVTAAETAVGLGLLILLY
jgi:NADH-quinone oxidoreductase subunit K